MPSLRRSTTTAIVALLTFASQSPAATADDPRLQVASASASVEAPPSRPGATDVPDVARGLIVKTTTPTPSDGLLAATDDALGAAADVVDDTALLTNVSTVDFDEVVGGDVAADVAAEVAQRADVVWASPNRLRQVQADPPVSQDDEFFARQWNLWNTGHTTNPDLNLPTGGYSIKAPSLWRATEGSEETVVAVIDTGILADHPDLAGQVVPGHDMVSRSAYDHDSQPGRDADATDPGDWYDDGDCPFPGSDTSTWHGTFVAGQVAAATDNGIGIAGVAPNVKVQGVRALGSCGGWDDDIIAGMRWAAGVKVPGAPLNATPATVVNLSIAGAPVSAAERLAECEVYNAAAREGKAAGAIFVASAGNDQGAANRVVPASCSELVSVGATSINGFRALYSNVGSTVDLSAPGGDLEVDPSFGKDTSRYDQIWSLGNAGAKQAGSHTIVPSHGTSMAAPQVAGAAALLADLGFTTPGSLTKALYASVSPFRATSGAYAKKRVGPDRYDLNCTSSGRQLCGRGLLDLSRVEVPLSPPVIDGSPVVGEPLTTSLGSWVRTPKAPTYSWKVDGVLRGTSRVYWPTTDDVGKPVTVTVAPSTSAFTRLTNVSDQVTVADGPLVTLSAPSPRPTYAEPFTVTADVAGATAGMVELRTDDGAVYGTGTVDPTGRATITVAASTSRRIRPSGTSLRAAFLGDGATARASSPRRTVTVRRLTAKVSTKLRRSVRTTSRATLSVEVRESPDVFKNPTGELRVYDGTRRILITRLYSNSGGQKSIRLPRLQKGTHRIRVYFKDSDYITSTYSAVRTIKAS